MANDYQSFLVRCWQTGDGSRRIMVEHVQSGERTLLATLDATVAWLGNHLDAVKDDNGSPGDQPGPSPPYPTGHGREGA